MSTYKRTTPEEIAQICALSATHTVRQIVKATRIPKYRVLMIQRKYVENPKRVAVPVEKRSKQLRAYYNRKSRQSDVFDIDMYFKKNVV
jgi:hypothetical protein